MRFSTFLLPSELGFVRGLSSSVWLFSWLLTANDCSVLCKKYLELPEALIIPASQEQN